MLAAILTGAGIWFWRRRAANAGSDFEESVAAPKYEPVAEPAIETASQPTVAPPPAPKIVPAKSVVVPPSDGPRAELALEFLPDRAVVSVANLTVSGRMRLINKGKAAAHGMQLRIALTSASHQQAAVIASFHRDKAHFEAKDLGDIGPGKSIDMDIELGIALGDLQSFTVNGQQLFVPMLLANIDYGWDARDGSDSVEFACLIGRESKPPQPKMGPLRLDLGPRSFGELGQRALAA